MQLALGTAQFGMGYGIAGRGEAVSQAEARAILVRAAELGIRTLDTAARYGDIEERLAGLCEGLEFNIVSKIRAVPADSAPATRGEWAVEEARRSLARLGSRLRVLMMHRAEDLLAQGADSVWDALHRWGEVHGVSIGVSCYEPGVAKTLRSRFPISTVQLPGNALDQRVAAELTDPPGFALHLRSVFLQGLLLMDWQEAVRRLPASAAALERWHRWCATRGLSPLRAALSVAKSFSPVEACVVGVDSLDQLEQMAAAWSAAEAKPAPELSIGQLDIIDPRRWRL